MDKDATIATATVAVTSEQVSDMLSTAFEGGSNYWYANLDYDLGDGYTIADFRKGGRCQYPGTYFHWSQLIPLVEGCALTFEDSDDDGATPLRLDREKVMAGAQVMAAKYPQHFADWMNEDGDATTGDVFLQCCVFGELVYG